MKRTGRDVVSNNPTAFSTQAANDQDVRENPDANENRRTLHSTPLVTVINHAQAAWSAAPFFSSQQGHATPSVGATGVGPGVDMYLTASQPMLREPEATNSAQRPGNHQMDAISSYHAAGSSDPGAAEATWGRNYRSELAAWVDSGGPDLRAIYQAVEKSIHAYLDAPEKQAWTFDLSNVNIRTFPPLPINLRTLDVNSTLKLTALPAKLPEGLQKLNVSKTKLIALPASLPQGLQKLDISGTDRSALPAHLSHGLQLLNVRYTKMSPAALLTLIQTNTSITEPFYELNNPVLSKGIEQELANNRQHPARLANAAASLDLLTRLAFTTSDQTGRLIHRPATPHPVAGQLPEQCIPAKVHDVLAANSSKSLLAVLAGMVDGTSQ